MTKNKAVLITGGRSGIGRALAEGMNKGGEYVPIVTVRKESDCDALVAAGIPAIVFDVTKDEDVEPAVKAVQGLLAERGVRLVGVIANAGINPEGDRINEADAKGEARPTELSHPSVATAVFATNVVGMARTARAFLPLLRESAEGRLILIGSYFGSMAGALGAGHLYYEASKHAVEALADGLRRSEAQFARTAAATASAPVAVDANLDIDLNGNENAAVNETRTAGKAHGSPQPSGIHPVRVSLVKPGNISTNMNPEHGEDGPEIILSVILHALGSPRPRHRYRVGRVRGNPVWLICWIFDILPTWIQDRFLV